MSNNTGATGGGAGAGKVVINDFHFSKQYDKSSPLLLLSTVNGKHYPKAVLFSVKAGKNGQYLKYTLTDVMVTSFQTAGSQGSVPMDQFSLNFAKIEVEYSPTGADGSLQPPVKAGFEVDGGVRGGA